MNKTRAIKTAHRPAKPVKVIPPEHQDEAQPQADSLNISPERIMDGASTQTEVLVGILAQTETTYHWRHWGINE